MNTKKTLATLVMVGGLTGLGYSIIKSYQYGKAAEYFANQPIAVQHVELYQKVREAEEALRVCRRTENENYSSPAEYSHKLKKELNSFEKREDHIKNFQAYKSEAKKENQYLLYAILSSIPFLCGMMVAVRSNRD